jgi:hypothetical protein
VVRLAACPDREVGVIDDARLRAESGQIERLLGELRELVTPPAWQRIEQVLARVVALYGAGLEHALEHARAAGAAPAALDERLTGDELLASLLVLHGLHPLPAEERILRALAVVRAQLDLADHELVLAELTDAGVVHLEATVALGGGAMAARVAEGITRRAIEVAAPEVTAIELVTPPTRDPGLVQIRSRRGAP